MELNLHDSGSYSLLSLSPQKVPQNIPEDNKEITSVAISVASPEEIKPIDGGVPGWLSVAGSSMGYINSNTIKENDIFIPLESIKVCYYALDVQVSQLKPVKTITLEIFYPIRIQAALRMFLSQAISSVREELIPSTTRWMGSFQFALPFIGGLVVGRLFDAGYTRVVLNIGSLVFIFSLFMLSLAKPMQYYQVFLSQGLGMGLGLACLFMPATTVISLRFRRRRSWATGVALTGISFGAVTYPIITS
ncbi:hypothetical protein M422DRAFT_49705 [Sphaerobolus stellatus SS14]|uniref:Major facilitator superfamily (MFS) profile domain-containing protein n=1 Tax=Sphaerobolus stellatus (strain SS14) TaxID=990650 RepID=A0A0C9VC45_SPHS4|nr:hypothetical protein M422DRAFT_49705 [Sphaerobolus stellatus SS14]